VQYARAFGTLTFTSFRRLLWSVGTLMLVFPPAACALFVVRRGYGSMPAETAFNLFSQFLVMVFASFVVPLCCVTFGATAVGGDRDDGTLLFLLMRPLPRGLIIAAKFAAALPLSVGFVCGGLWILCRLAGPPGRLAFDAYLPPVFYMTAAYTALFLLFGTLVRHAVIVGLIYTLLMEVFLGNVPGIIKQLAINYYGRSLMFDAGVDEGLTAPDPQWFDPLTSSSARWTLWGITLAAWCVAWVVFQVREYEDGEN
jgi:ABC-2 type transport system permease protein